MEAEECSLLMPKEGESSDELSLEEWRQRIVWPLHGARELEGAGLFGAFAIVIVSFVVAAVVAVAFASIIVHYAGFADVVDRFDSEFWATVTLVAFVAVLLVSSFVVWVCVFFCCFAFCTAPLFFKWSRRRLTKVSEGQEVIPLTPVGAITSLTRGDCVRAASQIRKNPAVKTFRLGMEQGAGFPIPIYDALAAAGGLEMFSCVCFDPAEEGPSLARCLSSNTSIRALYVDSRDQAAEDAEEAFLGGTLAVVQAIADTPLLTFLQLRGPAWGSVILELARALEDKPRLAFVTISTTDATSPDDVEELVTGLSLTCPELVSIELDNRRYRW